MIKGFIKITNELHYRILALEKTDPEHGEIVADIALEDLKSTIRVFRKGLVIVSSEHSTLYYDLNNGSMNLE